LFLPYHAQVVSITPGSTVVVFNAYDQHDSASGTLPEFKPFGGMTANLFDEAPWPLEEVRELCRMEQGWVEGLVCPCRLNGAGLVVDLLGIKVMAHN